MLERESGKLAENEENRINDKQKRMKGHVRNLSTVSLSFLHSKQTRMSQSF